jgi:hypothetical protein
LRKGYWGEYLDLRGTKLRGGENYIMRSFITFYSSSIKEIKMMNGM